MYNLMANFIITPFALLLDNMIPKLYDICHNFSEHKNKIKVYFEDDT